MEINPTKNNGSVIEEEGGIALERGAELMSRTLDRVEAFIRDRPGTALLCAVGLGFLVGRLVRR